MFRVGHCLVCGERHERSEYRRRGRRSYRGWRWYHARAVERPDVAGGADSGEFQVLDEEISLIPRNQVNAEPEMQRDFAIMRYGLHATAY